MATPKTAPRFPQSMDPGDLLDFSIDWSNILDVERGEKIDPSNWTLTVDADAVLAGLEVQTGARAPQLFEDDRKLGLWFGVDGGRQNDPAFDAGVSCGIKVVVQTTNDPFRRFERSFVVQVVNK